MHLSLPDIPLRLTSLPVHAFLDGKPLVLRQKNSSVSSGHVCLWLPNQARIWVHSSCIHRKQKMAELSDLNYEILSFIITLLATSANGATNLARLSATCHKFLNLSRDTEVLKVVNFQKISVEDYGAHHHLNDLLCVCARAGNQAAQSNLGKALLHNDAFFWRMILEHDIPLLARDALATGLLRHQKLVRRFICDASDEDISIMRTPLLCYMITCLGYDVACFSGILLAIANMCSYYLEKRVNLVNDAHTPPLRGVKMASAWLTPPSGQAHRVRVLRLYDQTFNGRE